MGKVLKFFKKNILQIFIATIIASSSAVTSAGALAPADTLVVAYKIDELITLDPAAMFEFAALEYAYNCYDRLIKYDIATNKFIGIIAKDWQITADGLTYIFKINTGLKFASGKAITAEDVAFSLQRAVLLNKAPSSILTQFGLSADKVRDQISVVAPGQLKIQFSQAFSANLVLHCLTNPVASIVEKAVVLAHQQQNDLGNAWLSKNHAGSGAFKLTKWQPNEILILERNAYAAQKNLVAKVIVRHVSEAATQKLLLERGDVDIARNLQANNLEQIKDPLKIIPTVKNNLICLYLNKANPNLQHKAVLQAIKYLIDYHKIKDTILKNMVIVQQSFIPQGFLGASANQPFNYNVAKAKQLLASVSLDQGFSINLDAKNIMLAQVIQAGCAAANIKINIIPGDSKQVLTKFRSRNYDAVLGSWGTDYFDPHANATSFTSNPDNSATSANQTIAWRTNWEIPELTALTKQAAAELDLNKRIALYTKIQQEFFEQAPIVILFQETDIAAVNAKAFDLKVGFDPATNVFNYLAK